MGEVESVDSEKDCVLIAQAGLSAAKGALFVEAQLDFGLHDEWCRDVSPEDWFKEVLERQLNLPDLVFELHEDILVNEGGRLGEYYEPSRACLIHCKVVEYVGTETKERCYSSNKAEVLVQVYGFYYTPSESDEKIPSGEIFHLPNIKFDGLWDELVFNEDRDIKADLIWMMTNLVRFSEKSRKIGKMAPSLLLHGAPGTGKTTLCQGLAQQISIRLKKKYRQTLLIQIDTANLLSKYFSESAKQVREIFTTLQKWCEEDPDRYICVLIDEVESIATSRMSVSRSGECQDSLRVTNALLTGMDRTNYLPNLFFLFASNLPNILDTAFIDRCENVISVDPPSIEAQYQILRTAIQDLIAQGSIESKETLSSYQEALVDVSISAERFGSKLLNLVRSLHCTNLSECGISESGIKITGHSVRSVHSTNTSEFGNPSESGIKITGRSLKQLPKQAISRYLRVGKCDLASTLMFIEQHLRSAQHIKKRKAESQGDLDLGRSFQTTKGEMKSRRRTRVKIEVEGCDSEFLKSLGMQVKISLDEKVVGEGKITAVEVADE